MRQTLYLTEPGLMLRRSKGALVLSREGRRIKSIAPHLVGRVMLWRGAAVTTPALRLLLNHGVDVALFERGRYVGAVSPPLSAGVVLRIAQVARFLDGGFALGEARRLVRDKCQGQAELLRRMRSRGGPADLSAVIRALDRSAGDAMTAPALDSLRGIEGSAARVWFEAFASLIPAPFAFVGRNRRPPRDPVNALLSLGYMLLTHEVHADVQARGLDPRLGFFHALRAGRPALALDLIEPWRAPFVDRLVLTVLRRRQFAPTDFRVEARGEVDAVMMKPDSLRRFVDAFEQHMGPREGGEGSSRRVLLAAWIDGFEARLMDGFSLPGDRAEQPDAGP